MFKKLKKIATALTAVVAGCGSFLTPVIAEEAGSISAVSDTMYNFSVHSEDRDETYTGKMPQLVATTPDGGTAPAYKLVVGGEYADGAYSFQNMDGAEKYLPAQEEQIRLAMALGYNNSNHNTIEWYMATQTKIFEILLGPITASWGSVTVPDGSAFTPANIYDELAELDALMSELNNVAELNLKFYTSDEQEVALTELPGNSVIKVVDPDNKIQNYVIAKIENATLCDIEGNPVETGTPPVAGNTFYIKTNEAETGSIQDVKLKIQFNRVFANDFPQNAYYATNEFDEFVTAAHAPVVAYTAVYPLLNAVTGVAPASFSLVSSVDKSPIVGATLRIREIANKEGTKTFLTEDKPVVNSLGTNYNYLLEEIASPKGWYFVNSTVAEAGKTHVLEADPIKYSIGIKDSETGEFVSGATIVVLDEEKNQVTEFTTGNEATEIGNLLDAGKRYTFQVKEAPEGYEVTQEGYFDIPKFGPQDAMSLAIEAINIAEQESFAEVTKTNSDGDIIRGAVLQVVDMNGDVVDEWTTGDEAHTVTGLVPGEKYILRETKTPSRYITIADTGFTAEAEGQTVELNAIDQQLTVGIVDVDDNYITDIDFEIVNKDGMVVDRWTSDEDPYIVNNLQADRSYTIRQLNVNDGYMKAADRTFTINTEGKDETIRFVNPQAFVSKTDVDGNPLEGAAMELKTFDGTLVDSWTTDGEAHLVKGLSTNTKYILSEVNAPEGYVMAKDLEFTTAADKNTEITIVDQQVFVEIVDPDNVALKGATLQVLNVDGTILDEWVSDGTAHVVDGLKAGESYTLHESKTPEGYVTALDVPFTVESNLKNMTVTMKNGTAEVRITDENEELLSGVNVEVLDEKGNIVDSWTSSENSHFISGMKAGESYTIHEASATKGYYFTQDFDFIADTAGSKMVITRVHALINYSVSKIDDNGEAVEGVTLSLTDITNKNTPESVGLPNKGVTTAEPFELNKVLEAGHTYELEETNVIGGYYPAVSQTFTVPQFGTADVVKIAMEDPITDVSFEIADNHGNPVVGAKFQVIEATVTDEDVVEGNVVHEFTTTEEGYDLSEYVIGGATYILREVEAPFGYDKAEDLVFEVTGNKEEAQVISVINNVSQINLDIVSTNSDGSEKLAGAEFEVYSAATDEIALTIDGEEAKGTVDEAGKLSFVLEYSEDGYYVKETKAPDEYEMNKNEFALDIKEGFDFTQAYTVSVAHEKTPVTGLSGGNFAPFIACIGGGLAIIGAVVMGMRRKEAE